METEDPCHYPRSTAGPAYQTSSNKAGATQNHHLAKSHKRNLRQMQIRDRPLSYPASYSPFGLDAGEISYPFGEDTHPSSRRRMINHTLRLQLKQVVRRNSNSYDVDRYLLMPGSFKDKSFSNQQGSSRDAEHELRMRCVLLSSGQVDQNASANALVDI